MTLKPENRSSIIILLFGIIIFGYVSYRAYNVAFTYDESLSYLAIKGFNFKIAEMTHVENQTTLVIKSNRLVHFFAANNHYLNTLGMFLCSKTFGDSELSLRLPNLLALIIYLIFSYKLLSSFKNKYLLLGGIVVLFTNPYLLEFFGLARGYGLALGFMMAAFYYFKTWIELRRPVLTRASILMMLSVLSNLAFFNLYLAFTVVALFIITMRNPLLKHNGLKYVLTIHQSYLLINTFFIIVILPLLIFLDFTGQLFFGAETFIGGTVVSLIKAAFLYNGFIPAYLAYLVFIGFLSILAFFIGNYLKNNTLLFEFCLSLIILIVTVIVILQNSLLGTPLPLGRSGIYFIPLGSLLILFMVNTLEGLRNLKMVSLIFIAILTLVSLVNLGVNFSTDTTYSWRKDNNSRKVFNEIMANSSDKDEIRVCCGNKLEPVLNYYRVSRKVENMPQISVSGNIDPTCNFFYFPEDRRAALDSIGGKIIEFKKTNSILLIKGSN